MQIKSLLKQFSMVKNIITDYRLDEMRRRQERDDILLLSQSTTALYIFKCELINVNIKKKRKGKRIRILVAESTDRVAEIFQLSKVQRVRSRFASCNNF